MNSIAIKIIKILIKNELGAVIEHYEKLDKKINNKIKNQILSRISKATNEVIINIFLEYFEKYKIKITQEQHKEAPRSKKRATRVKESSESIKKRQRAFIKRKKDTGAKKVQIYISAEAHEKLKSLKNIKNSTYSELIENLIIEKYS
jgi:hypothetical protein